MDDLQLDFVSFRTDGSDLYRYGVARDKICPGISQTAEIWGQLNKYPVVPYAADDPCYRVSGGEIGCVLEPCAEQLLVTEEQTGSFPVNSRYQNQNLLPGTQSR